jgi:aryl-alcohol dehydrogenase-like predicted oxidoreductase
MDTRNLGSAGLVSSAIGLGTHAFTGAYGPVSKRECDRVLRLALDTGVVMIDTTRFPGQARIEDLIGESLSERRDDALIATSGGMRVNASGTSAAIDGAPASLTMACDESLRRLRTDCIDLFYLSHVDPRVQVEDSIGKLAELVSAGKIRYLGLGDTSPDYLRRAHATYSISAIAVEYSLRERSAEERSIAVAAELGVGIVARCPLSRGLLAGNISAEVSAHERKGLRAVAAEAAELDLGMARLSLAWLLSRRGDVVPIPSTRNPVHLEMNASASGIQLDRDTCARLAHMFPGTPESPDAA